MFCSVTTCRPLGALMVTPRPPPPPPPRPCCAPAASDALQALCRRCWTPAGSPQAGTCAARAQAARLASGRLGIASQSVGGALSRQRTGEPLSTCIARNRLGVRGERPPGGPPNVRRRGGVTGALTFRRCGAGVSPRSAWGAVPQCRLSDQEHVLGLAELPLCWGRWSGGSRGLTG